MRAPDASAMRAMSAPCVRVEPKTYPPPWRKRITGASSFASRGTNHSEGTPPASTFVRFTRASAGLLVFAIASNAARCSTSERVHSASNVPRMARAKSSKRNVHDGRAGPRRSRDAATRGTWRARFWRKRSCDTERSVARLRARAAHRREHLTGHVARVCVRGEEHVCGRDLLRLRGATELGLLAELCDALLRQAGVSRVERRPHRARRDRVHADA